MIEKIKTDQNKWFSKGNKNQISETGDQILKLVRPKQLIVLRTMITIDLKDPLHWLWKYINV